MFLQGLKHSPYDKDLKFHFHNALNAMKQQYHIYSAPSNGAGGPEIGNPATLFDLGGMSITDDAALSKVNGAAKVMDPERGYRDKYVNSLIKRSSGFINIQDLVREEVTFWATYGVYLSRREVRNDCYSIVCDFKEILKDVFLSYSRINDPLDEAEVLKLLDGGDERKDKGLKRSLYAKKAKPLHHSFKNTAKRVIQLDKKEGAVDGRTVNGLDVVVQDESSERRKINKMIKASNEHEAFLPIFMERCMTGSQYIAACMASGLITQDFGLVDALKTLHCVTGRTKSNEKKAMKNQQQVGSEQDARSQAADERSDSGQSNQRSDGDDDDGDGDGDSSSSTKSDSETESDSCTSFDSDSDDDESDEDSDEEEDKNSRDRDFEQITSLPAAYVFASEYSLLFPQFVECTLRIISNRYGPVVPKEIIDKWIKDQEEYNTYQVFGRGEGGIGDEDGSPSDMRRKSRIHLGGMSDKGSALGGPQPPQRRHGGFSPLSRGVIRRVSALGTNAANNAAGGGRRLSAVGLNSSNTPLGGGGRRLSAVGLVAQGNNNSVSGGRRLSYSSNSSERKGTIGGGAGAPWNPRAQANGGLLRQVVQSENLAIFAVRLR